MRIPVDHTTLHSVATTNVLPHMYGVAHHTQAQALAASAPVFTATRCTAQAASMTARSLAGLPLPRAESAPRITSRAPLPTHAPASERPVSRKASATKRSKHTAARVWRGNFGGCRPTHHRLPAEAAAWSTQSSTSAHGRRQTLAHRHRPVVPRHRLQEPCAQQRSLQTQHQCNPNQYTR